MRSASEGVEAGAGGLMMGLWLQVRRVRLLAGGGSK